MELQTDPLWKWIALILVMIWLLTACGGETENRVLPTLITVQGDENQAVETLAAGQNSDDRATLPATWTPGPSPTETLTPIVTPSFTITATTSWTPTITPIPTETATLTVEVDALALLLQDAIHQLTEQPSTFTAPQPAQATATIQGFGNMPGQVTLTTAPNAVTATPIAAGCTYFPPGGFAAVFNDPAISSAIGCPLGSPPVATNYTSAFQRFERGSMLWLSTTPGQIYILAANGNFQRVTDTYDENVDPVSGGETPPSGLFEPVRGFGKVWRTVPGVRDQLGWATGQEIGGPAVALDYQRGRMVATQSRGDILVLVNDPTFDLGTWVAVPGQY